ncbi:MAG: hypothetical protein AAF993_19105 [Pseudomonadota bacterium]
MAATQLAPAREVLFQLLGLEQDYQDPGVGEFGLENSVMAIGETFLEIVAPVQADTAAGRTLSRMNADACGYMALFQVDNFATCAAHLEAAHMRQVWSVERPEVSACHIHPKDIGGAIVSFDEMRPAEEWVWAGPNWRAQQASQVSRILGCELGSPDPASLAQRWSLALDLPLTMNDKDQLCIRMSDGTFVAFTDNPAYTAIQRMIFATPQPEQVYAHAAELGLSDSGRPMLGQLSLSFVTDASGNL